MALIAHLGNFITHIKYIGMLTKHALSRISLAPYDSNLPFQPSILFMILSTMG
jgi:hypothetical protein